ncbi:MAG: hypothetical protein CMI09_12220 [Oceanospirillaceae bacterium]|nr:hypothetical protein [Oceanospirillaceae bacterium]|tara:strand:- start:1544 stop:1930 length:387 start_codon:yes stop_codon:yes gene_type:complete
MQRPPEFKQPHKTNIDGDELTSCVAFALADELKAHGIQQLNADTIALNIMDEVRRLFGGCAVYFKIKAAARRSERNQEIYQRFARNELSIPEISEQYGISFQWAYSIIREQRELTQAATQTTKVHTPS